MCEYLSILDWRISDLEEQRKLKDAHKGTSEFPELWDMLLEWKVKRKLTLADTACISKRSFKTVKNELHKAAVRKKRTEGQ